MAQSNFSRVIPARLIVLTSEYLGVDAGADMLNRITIFSNNKACVGATKAERISHRDFDV